MRRLMAAFSAVKRWPSSSISPDVGSSNPVMQPMVVLFPEPFGPRKPNMVPARTVSDRFSTATVGPYFFTRLVNRIASIGSASSFHYRQQFLTPGNKQRAGGLERYHVKPDSCQRQGDDLPPVAGGDESRGPP